MQDDAKSKQKEKTKREKIGKTRQRIGKSLKDEEFKETQLGSHEELYIKLLILRILLGKSLKISVMVATTWNKKLQLKKQVEIMIQNSIYM